jgi:hypothetical protein
MGDTPDTAPSRVAPFSPVAPPSYRASFLTRAAEFVRSCASYNPPHGTAVPTPRCPPMNNAKRRSSLSPEFETGEWKHMSPISYVPLAVLIVLVGVLGIFALTAPI